MGNRVEDIRTQVEAILAAFNHPTLQKNIIQLKALTRCVELDGKLHIELTLPFVWSAAFEQLKQVCSDQIRQKTAINAIEWTIHYDIAMLQNTNKQPAIKGVRNIIAVSSGKGGVGKSSIAVNLALALAHEGAKVGILDADIYGPSIPLMLGTTQQRPTSPDGEHMVPVMAYGLASNSIGYLVSDENAMVWRGPMASKALLQMLHDTLWPNLDYLVLDMPPGTGDIQLTLAQSIPVTGAVVVTTPQDVALIDAMKGVIMFEKVDVSILGIIENMSVYICRHCGHHEYLFGHDGAKKISEKHHVKLLSQLPLYHFVREDADSGTPTVIKRPDSEFSQQFYQLADCLTAELFWRNKVIPSAIPVKSIS